MTDARVERFVIACDGRRHTLRLSARGGRATVRREADRLVLQGEVPWLLEGSRAAVAACVAAMPRAADLLADGVAELRFGNSVGRFPLPGGPTIEVVSGKWGRKHFATMLAELTTVAAALPFSGRDGGSLPYDRRLVAREDVLYHAFVYLRHVLDVDAPREMQLAPAITAILRDPHRRAARIRRHTDPALARRVDARTLMEVAAGQGGMRRASGAAARMPLARSLHGHVPERMTEVRLTATLDTPENRFVKHLLALCAGIVARMREVVDAKPDRRESVRVRADCDRLDAALQPLLRHGMWREVGPMVHFPAASTVLQRRAGYREALRHFVRLRATSRLPLDEAATRDLLELRDIATLYELWTYFTLVDVLQTRKGPPRRAFAADVGSWSLDVPHELTVAWADGTRVVYNASFRRSGRRDRRTYSVGLRPDIALELPGPGGGQLHLLDAKFRLRWRTARGDGDGDGAERAERQGDYQRADLYKMHTYRDAIPRARTVWVLYPGTETEFFDAGGWRTERIGESRVPWTAARGVGVLPLRPEDGGRRMLELWVDGVTD